MTTLTVTTGFQNGDVIIPAIDINWGDLGSAPYGTWANWTDWRPSTGTQVVIQLDDDEGSIGYRIPNIKVAYLGDLTAQLKISDTGTFTGEETTINFVADTETDFVSGRYYRWTLTIDANSANPTPLIGEYLTYYTDDLSVETLEDVDVFASGTTTLSTNLGLVRNIQATALSGDPYVVTDYVIESQGTEYTRTAKTLSPTNVAVDNEDFKVGSNSFVMGELTPVTLNGEIEINMGTDIDHGTNNFTYEAWVNLDSSLIGTLVDAKLFHTQLDSASGGLFNVSAMCITAEPSNWAIEIDIYIDGVQRSFTTLPYTLVGDTWYHVAIVRNGTDLRCYVDGTSYASYTITGAGEVDSLPSTFHIGGPASAPYYNYWFGYIDEVRISTTARYTGSFTPSTSPHTNDADTILLLHAEDFTDDGGTSFVGPYFVEQQGGSPVITSKNPPKVQVHDYDGNLWDGTVDVVLRGYPKIVLETGGVRPVTI